MVEYISSLIMLLVECYNYLAKRKKINNPQLCFAIKHCNDEFIYNHKVTHTIY